MKKKCIVTFANNEDRYVKGADRLQESLKSVGFDGDFIRFGSFEEIFSPAHYEVPYAFKPYAIERVRKMGYDLVLWCDAPVYAVKSLGSVFDFIEKNGYLFFDNIGYTIGDYTSDRCLELFSWTREKAFNSKMIMACVMGFDFTNEKTVKFFDEYLLKSKEAGYYEGSWFNDSFQVSLDRRVRGHRHDQSVASILISDMKLKITHPHSTFFAYYGNPGHLPHADSLCLFSQGY